MFDIEKEFRVKAIVHGGVKLFEADLALKIIEKCRNSKKRVLGFDAFRMIGDKIQPILECGIDYTSSTNKIKSENIWDDASTRIKNLSDKNFLFEIVVD